MFRSVLEGAERGQSVTVDVEGVAVEAWPGETVAGVVLRHLGNTRRNPVDGQARGPFCMMGVCFECLVEIDGRGSQQSCLVPVRDGMRIVRQTGVRRMQR